ncbi:MAG: gliding motility-associated C-terminal domain-containing protein [Bacteroidia bacterium]
MSVKAHKHEHTVNKVVNFTENKGQWESQVLYKADIPGGAMFLEKTKITYAFYDTYQLRNVLGHNHNNGNHAQLPEMINFHGLQMDFLNANPQNTIETNESLKSYSNYFIGNDKSKWASFVKSYRIINYHNFYQGIDLKVYSTDKELKYDFIVAPQSNPQQIKWKYNGAEKLTLKNGSLFIKTSVNEIIENKPYAYQIINGTKQEVSCKYIVKNDVITFDFPNGYDKNHELIIDPVLNFSTYSGSFANNFGFTATFDSKGFLYAGGIAFGVNYPTTIGAYQVNFAGGTIDMAITKYDTTGTSLIYSTYIGGSGSEAPHSLIVNSNDELFIFGTTGSANYPTTVGAYDNTFNGGTTCNLTNGLGYSYNNGSDIVISRLSTNGANLMASTYVGGSGNDGVNSLNTANATLVFNELRYNYADEIRGEIMIDANNNIYVASCTRSTDFPVTAGSFQTTYGGGSMDGVIIKMDNNLSNMIWSSYIGGSLLDAIFSIELDVNDDLLITGGTNSNNFPVTTGTYQTTFGGGRSDGFVALISKNGQQILKSTYFGSAAYDQSYFVKRDKQNNIYIYGQTEAPSGMFVINATFNSPNSGQFITKFRPDLDTIIWSTRFGSGIGVPNISPTAFAVDLCNKVYLSGWGGAVNGFGGTNNMPVTANAYQSTTDNSDFYLMVMEDDASALNYGSFFGSPFSSEHVDGGTSRFDRRGRMYQSVCAGCGGDSNFPTTPGAWSSVNNSSCNNAVFKFDFNLPFTLADFDAPPIDCTPYTVNFNNTSMGSSSTSYFWDFGDGNTSTLYNPTHTYTTSGTFTITLITIDSLSCNISDTVVKQVTILSDTTYTLPSVTICGSGSQQIGLLPNSNTSITYTWTPATGLSATNISNPFASPANTTTYQLLISNGICTDTVYQTVNVIPQGINTSPDTTICGGNSITLVANSAFTNYIWSSNPNFTDTLNTPLTNNSISITPSNSTTYYVLGFTGNCSSIDSVHVTVINQNTTQNPSTNICRFDTLQIGILPDSSSNITYTWLPNYNISSTSVSNPSVWPDVDTSYTLIISNGICADTLIYPITVTHVNLQANADTTICQGASLLLSASNGTGSGTYIWSNNPSFSPALNNPNDSTVNVLPVTNTSYYVQTTINGCTAVDTVQVNVSSVNVTTTNISVCNPGQYTLTATATPTNVSYQWQPSALIVSGANTASPTVIAQSNSSYQVIATNTNGCSDTAVASITISALGLATVNAYADEDTLINGESTTLHVTPASGYNIVWAPASGLSNAASADPIATPNSTTEYIVSITDAQGCSRTDTLKITVIDFICEEPYIYLPNAFTPNGDGQNDILYLRGNLIDEMYLAIYNRWGELVFESTSPQVGWDGTYKGMNCDPAVFVYYFTVKCRGGQEYFKKGNITLIR